MVVLRRRTGHLLVGVLAACALAAGAVPVLAKEKVDPPPGQERKAEQAAQQQAVTTESSAPAASTTPSGTSERSASSTESSTQVRTASRVLRGRGSDHAAAHSAVVRRAEAAAPQPAPTPAAPQPAPATEQPPAAAPRERGKRRSDRKDPRRRAGAPAPAPATAPRSTIAPAAVPAPAAPAAPQEDPAPRRESRERPATADPAPPVERSDEPSVVTRTVTEVVEVIPAPLRYLLVALAVLALLAFAGFAGAAARARRTERRRRVLAGDIGLLQSALLPELPERVGPAFVTAAYRPASGPAAGGDFYDVFALDEHRTCVLLGDVAGHGREALPLTAAVRYTMRAYLESGLSPRRALQLAGEVLDGQLRGQLVTVLAAVYDARTSELTYASAGHPAPVVDGAAPPREVCGSPPLGTRTPTGRRGTTVTLAPGTTACFYTDGVFDVRVAGGRLGADRLHAEIDALGPALTAAQLLDRVTAGAARQADDMAAVVLRAPIDAAAAPAIRRDELEVDLAELAGPRPRRLLEASGIDAGATADALASAAGIVAYAGTATILVTRQDAAADVVVHPTGPIPLRYSASA